MLSATDPANRKLSWVTVMTARRRSASVRSRRSTPSSRTQPSVGSQKRAARRATVVLPAPVAPTTASVWPAGISRSSSWSTVRSRYPNSTPSKRTSPVRVGQRRGRDRLGHARRLGEHAGELLRGGGRGLEQVVELAELLHRREELAQVEQERGEHAHGHLAVEHPVRAHQQHERDGQPADELHAGAVDAGQPARPVVGAPVAVVEVLEDLLVAGLAPEGVDGVDPAEALHEVHDHQRHGLPGGPVGQLGSTAEGPGHHEQDRERGEADRARAGRSIKQQRDADADDRAAPR